MDHNTEPTIQQCSEGLQLPMPAQLIASTWGAAGVGMPHTREVPQGPSCKRDSSLTSVETASSQLACTALVRLSSYSFLRGICVCICHSRYFQILPLPFSKVRLLYDKSTERSKVKAGHARVQVAQVHVKHSSGTQTSTKLVTYRAGLFPCGRYLTNRKTSMSLW